MNFWEVISFYFALTLDRDIILDRNIELDRDLALDCALDFTLDCDRARVFAPTFARSFDLVDLDLDHAFALTLVFAGVFDLDRNRFLNHSTEFQKQLQQLYSTFQNRWKENISDLQAWLKLNGEEWANNLRQLAIKYRNIGHDWQFTEEQSQKLVQYHKVNQLLIDCLKSECRISRSVREEIEETLFLPFEAIEH